MRPFGVNARGETGRRTAAAKAGLIRRSLQVLRFAGSMTKGAFRKVGWTWTTRHGWKRTPRRLQTVKAVPISSAQTNLHVDMSACPHAEMWLSSNAIKPMLLEKQIDSLFAQSLSRAFQIQ